MKQLLCTLTALAAALSLALPAGAAGNRFSDVPRGHWACSYVEEMAQTGLVSGVGEGRFDPDGNVSAAQFAVMLTNAFCPERQAGRGEGSPWWEPYLDAAWEAGYLADTTAGWSYEDGTWDAAVVEAPMTRYDMAQAMWNTVLAEGLTAPTDGERAAAQAAIGDFAVIPEDYESAVVAMYALGCLSGINEDGDFGGQNAMTRAQACVALGNLLEKSGWSPSGSGWAGEAGGPGNGGETGSGSGAGSGLGLGSGAGQSQSGAVQTEPQSGDYVLNTRSMKFHLPDCSGVDRMNSANRQDYTGSRQDLLDQGYSPCGICDP